MVTVGNLMQKTPVTVDAGTSVVEAAKLMKACNVESVLVARQAQIIGILTDTDMVRRVVATGADTQKTTVEQVMSAPILTIDENKTLLDANDLMAKTHIRHLGVTQDGKLAGMISVRDLVLFLTNLPRK